MSRDPDTVRIPDISYVSRARQPEGLLPRGFLDLTPDIAVEVVLPEDHPAEALEKVQAYLQAGTSLAGLLYPDSKSVAIFL